MLLVLPEWKKEAEKKEKKEEKYWDKYKLRQIQSELKLLFHTGFYRERDMADLGPSGLTTPVLTSPANAGQGWKELKSMLWSLSNTCFNNTVT